MTAPSTRSLAYSLGLTEDEYLRIINYLERDPNFTELSVFSVMWSEHCSYKSSRRHLKKFPTSGSRVVQGPGENAGVVDIGDGQVVIFKMESHNHPSFIEPYQGAATGVGGILRDVFTMGGDPILLMDSLRFGSREHSKTRYLIRGIVSGISGYGNCFGCPTVGGETFFHESYNVNPLVNVFCLGLAEKDKVFYGRAKGVGNPVIYVGAKTGRDGIHGATMASQVFDDEAESKKPTVQVGDPFTEKLLLEACLEVMKHDYLMGIQDMGAAGLTSSSVEMASRAGNGIFLDLSKIPARESHMKPEEFLLSESQERMLLVVKQGFENEVRKIFEKWDLDIAVVGSVTNDGKFRVYFEGQEVVNIPVHALTEGAPLYDRPAKESTRERYVEGRLYDEIPRDARNNSPSDWGDVLMSLLSSPNLASKKWIYRQYDYQVKTNTVVLPGGDAAMVRVKYPDNRFPTGPHGEKGIAVSTDGNSRYCYLDPYQGGMLAVAEAARNVSCVGAEPIGLTDCLNFGNPENPEIMWQFQRAVEGISAACRSLDIPVVSGNVSFYNETHGISVYPTPVIGMVGLIQDIRKIVDHAFQAVGHHILLLGESLSSVHDESLDGSEYRTWFYKNEGTHLPHFDIELEKRVQKIVRQFIFDECIYSAHDCSEGGLAMALLESSFGKGIGAHIEYKKSIRTDSLLFGESSSRIIVTTSPKRLPLIEEKCKLQKIPYAIIGKTIPDRFIFNDFFNVEVKELKNKWEHTLEAFIG